MFSNFFSGSRNPLPSTRLRTPTGDALIQHHFKMIAALKKLRFDFELQAKAHNNGVLPAGKETNYLDVLDSMLRMMTLFNKTLPYSFNGTYALTQAQLDFLALFYRNSSNSNTALDTLCSEFMNQGAQNNSLEQKLEALSQAFIAEHNRYITRANFFIKYETAAHASLAALSVCVAAISIRSLTDAAFLAALNAAGAWLCLALIPPIMCVIFLFSPYFLQSLADPYRKKAEEILAEEFPRLTKQIASLQEALTSADNRPTADLHTGLRTLTS